MESLSIAVAGPSLLLGMPNLLWLLILGVVCTGFFGAFLFVPVLPEVIAALKEQFKREQRLQLAGTLPDSEIEAEVNKKFDKISSVLADKASACNNIAFSIGTTLGPLLGGLLTDHFGYRQTFDTMAVACFAFCVFNFFYTFVPRLCCGQKHQNLKKESTSAVIASEKEEASDFLLSETP